MGHLATATLEGRPHIVPCCFVLYGSTLYSAIDSKPKSTPNLRRIQNIGANGNFSFVVDHYDEDWTTLWWVRVDGSGRVVNDDDERDRALDLLAAKYEQYRDTRPPGAVLALEVEAWRSWP